jgi:hypothetical protein
MRSMGGKTTKLNPLVILSDPERSEGESKDPLSRSFNQHESAVLKKALSS